MTYFEMKMMVAVLSRILLDNEIRGEHTKKRIFNLISKLNGMLTKQGYKNAWTYIWIRNCLVLFCNNINIFNMGEL